MPTDTVSIAQFIKDRRISMTAERTDSNPNMGGDMDHWKCVLSRPESITTQARGTWEYERHGRKRRITVTFSQGYGHNGAEPQVDSVLDCLASDASAADESFEDFCSNFGYDTDSRAAEKTYKACKHTGDRLRKFLGEDDFQTLVYGGVERL